MGMEAAIRCAIGAALKRFAGRCDKGTAEGVGSQRYPDDTVVWEVVHEGSV